MPVPKRPGFLAETGMSDKSKGAIEPKKETEKKPPQPVELTDDQLLAITGGGESTPTPAPPPGSGPPS
jgi:hypothetical protein